LLDKRADNSDSDSIMAALSSFRAYGLNIASEFEIPGGIPLERPMAEADIVICADDTSIGEVEAVNGPYSRSGNALLFDAAGVARYYAPTSRQLFIEPYRGADSSDIGALLIATALPMLLWMRGGIVLHAAGIVPERMDRAIAIAGPSGIGKSTLAAGLVQTGACLVGDDSLWLTLRDDEPVVSGLSAMLFRSADSGCPRAEMIIPPESQVEQAQLSAIITLSITDSETQAAPRRLLGADAIQALLRSRHRPKIPAILGQEAALFPQCILHCRTLPIYELAMRHGDVAGSQRHIATMISDHFGSV
jgi:hypothetical protein